MYTIPPKKTIIINILEILKIHSDSDHPMSQREIGDILEKDYGMKVDRKSVKRNLMDLIDCGYGIEYTETVRKNKGEGEIVYNDWYLERDFSDAELRLLIDSLLFSKHIPHKQCKELICKLEGLSNKYFKSKVRHIRNLPEGKPENRELFYTIEILDEAIEDKKQVKFYFGKYGADKKLHMKLSEAGNPMEYIVNPYQMVATNGHYYLIGNYDKYDDISHYRMDHIKGIEILESKAKPKNKVKGLENGLNLPKHMAEHIYMFSGESVKVKMQLMGEYVYDQLVTWFGKNIEFSKRPDGTPIAEVYANESAMRYWAMQYTQHVKILEPQSLVDAIKSDLEEAIKKYK